MRTVPIHHNTPTPAKPPRSPEVVGLSAEICARLVEWSTLESEHRVELFLSRLVTLKRDYPQALWIVLHIMSGDVSEITRSYSSIGKDKGRSKQAVQQEFERSLAAIRIHFPEVADAIIQLRGISAKIESKSDEQGIF